LKHFNGTVFKEILRNMPICIDALDEQGNIIFWNKECERITGYSAREIIGNPHWLELLYPDPTYRNKLLNLWSKKGNNFRNWEMKLQTKNGLQKTISWSNLSDIFAIPGWHTWAVGVDVTRYFESRQKLEIKKKQFEIFLKLHAELQKAQTTEQIANVALKKLGKMVGAHGGLVLMYDFEHQRAEVVSAKFEQALFYHAENHISLKHLIHIAEAKQGKVMVIDDLSIYNQNVKLASLLIKKHKMKTAILIPLMFENEPIGSLSLYSKGNFNLEDNDKEFLSNVGRLLAFFLQQSRLVENFQERILDLEQKTIGQVAELKRNERRLRAQYESIPIPTYTWQKSGDDFILIDYNDMALASSYGKIGGLLGHKAGEIYANLPELVDLLRECYENEISIETQIKSTSPVKDHPNYLSIKLAYVAPDSVLMHIEDITQEYSARQTIHRLQGLNARQAEEIKRLHNDLSTIPNLVFPVLRQYLTQLGDRSAGSDEHPAKTNGEQNQDKVLTELNNILTFWEHYLSLHSIQVTFKAVNLVRLIQSLTDEHAAILKDIRTHIYLEVQDVYIDPDILRDILNGLIKFIVRHTSEFRAPILRIISTVDDDGRLVITLKDNGQGLAEPVLQALNGADRAAIPSSDPDFLDLFMIRRMVELLSGEFRIESQKHEGITCEMVFKKSLYTPNVPDEDEVR